MKKITKNSLARKFTRKVIKGTASVLSAPSRVISSIKSQKGRRFKLPFKMMSKAGLAEGTMGKEKYDKAFKIVRSSVKKGDMSGARKYIRSQKGKK